MKMPREFTLKTNELLPPTVDPDIIFVDSGELPSGELMPGIVLFNAPGTYMPVRVFVRCGADLEQFLIEDSEQTPIFSAALIREGDSCLLPKNGVCPAHLPTLNLSYQGKELRNVRVIVEYCRNPFFANDKQ